ncbi:uncharacterized protein FOMMEDRAFT_170502 [Fomitiporia mediterranea MF3/22]|uniref:uncharacterized protein n=1 Tax=Fomitiporia mediterranea (strain MF3/22) TaxID=694068 RepID=UPI00044083D4|nr:uncharacterized protein FOMMEDRAFT_170502 [Fomitiporia mediterranea MF3/22]EJC99145.1 hypothetical protein FOMMEDRAFT_170502 [Fomitiporia mediterranea MF3/22]
MSPVSYHIAQYKHATLVEPNPSLETPENSLAILYEVAWRDQDESALFHQMPVRRDVCKMRNIKVPENMTVLKWKHDTPFLKLHKLTGILIRDAYCRMLQAIESALWPTTEADKSSDAAMDVELDSRYNPFNTNVKPEEEVEGIVVSGGPGIGVSVCTTLLRSH